MCGCFLRNSPRAATAWEDRPDDRPVRAPDPAAAPSPRSCTTDVIVGASSAVESRTVSPTHLCPTTASRGLPPPPAGTPLFAASATRSFCR